MLKAEKQFHAFVRKHISVWVMLAILAVGVAVRIALIPFLSGDFSNFNRPWMREIFRGNITTMISDGRFNYSPLYFYLYKIAGDLFFRLINDVGLLCKLVSIAGEAVLSLGCFALFRPLLTDKRRTPLLFAGLWLNPILILNAAGWGQLDCYYALFCVLAVWLLIKEKPVWAMASFGFACAWKQQALLLLPLFILVYLAGRRRFSLLWFALVPAIMAATSLPMMWIGMDPFILFRIYFAQAQEHGALVLNYPNLYALLGTQNNASCLYIPVMVGVLAALFGLLAARVVKNDVVLEGKTLVLMGAWCVLACVYFLPRMHDRYAIVGEVLLLCYALLVCKPIVTLAAGLCFAATLHAYAAYLTASYCPEGTAVLMLTASLVLTSCEVLRLTAPSKQ